MSINWFPGHMLKARNEIGARLPSIDVVLEVLDARIVHSSQNPLLQDLIQHKPRLVILNKTDLADADNLALWQGELARQGKSVVLLSEDKSRAAYTLKEQITRLFASKIQANQVVHSMIIGIPNVGKSTIINSLAGRKIAKTGNEPAVTRHQQRIVLTPNWHLFDTPGLLYPKILSDNAALRLALTGAIKDSAFGYDEIGLFAAEVFAKHHPQSLQNRYGIEEITEPVAVLEAIGRARGTLSRGNVVDLTQAARILINDYRQGLLGNLTLETPDQVAQEILAAKQQAQKAQQQKTEHKQQRRARYLKNRHKR